MKKVLILGAGMVAKPIITYLLDRNYQVTVAAMNFDRVQELVEGYENGNAVEWTTDNTDMLDKMIAQHDLAVSLLPFKFHVMVAERCIAHGKNMVTTSYVKPEMQALDSAAKSAEIIILNEVGLDPGIDHMSAMRIIDNVHSRGGKIEEFYSLCGALPAPESANNPPGYKFSWSPKGVILASKNDALYLKGGDKKYIQPVDLFTDRFEVDFPKVGKLDVYPNRNSIDYIDIYNVKEAKTMYRGTFRLKGWCETLDAIKRLDLLDETQTDLTGKAWADLVASKVGAAGGDVKNAVAEHLNISIDSVAIKSMEWLGFFSNEPLNRTIDSAFEVVSDRMIEKMSMEETDRDMVVMLHSFLASYPDGKKEVIQSRMLDYGSLDADTAVARTVALPAAIAVEMILSNQIRLKGVFRPVLPEIYNPILDRLEDMNIRMIEEYGLPVNKQIG